MKQIVWPTMGKTKTRISDRVMKRRERVFGGTYRNSEFPKCDLGGHCFIRASSISICLWNLRLFLCSHLTDSYLINTFILATNNLPIKQALLP